MANKHTKCPNCGQRGSLEKIRCQRTKFSIQKAVVGSLVGGPIGMLIGGALGNKKYTYRCSECGFEQEPDSIL